MTTQDEQFECYRNVAKQLEPDGCFFFFSSRRRHTRSLRDWSSDVCSSDLAVATWAAEPAVTGTPAGTVVVRASGLRVHGGMVTAGDAVPSPGELAVDRKSVV